MVKVERWEVPLNEVILANKKNDLTKFNTQILGMSL